MDDTHSKENLILVNTMGDDLTIVNAARVSYDTFKRMLDSKDERLIRFLWENEHTSPFRHAQLQFRIHAPIFVLRQWMKHQIGCAWNERSGRYTAFDERDFWKPSMVRIQDNKVKQGLTSLHPRSEYLKDSIDKAFQESYASYQSLLEAGVCREQARSVLPLGLMSSCYWTASLQAVLHFLSLRLDLHSQQEIRLYAAQVYCLMKDSGKFDLSLEVWKNDFLKTPSICEDPLIRSLGIAHA